MSMYSSDGAPITPEQVGQLVVQPVMAASVAAQVSTVVNISAHDYRIPLVTDDPAAAWTAEGSEITPDDATLDELTVTPSKVAGLTIISRELAEDSSPAAQQVVGDGLARDIARKVDAAYFGNTTTNGPSGLGSLTTSTVVADWTNTDPFAEAISTAEGEGGSVSFFVASAADALVLAKVKKATGSNEPLLGSSATEPGQRRILGVPLVVSAQLTAGTIWGIDARYVQLVVRDNTRLEVDKSAYFSSDRVGVKATMRVGLGFTHPLALVKMTEAA